jgi:hypothetical protein
MILKETHVQSDQVIVQEVSLVSSGGMAHEANPNPLSGDDSFRQTWKKPLVYPRNDSLGSLFVGAFEMILKETHVQSDQVIVQEVSLKYLLLRDSHEHPTGCPWDKLRWRGEVDSERRSLQLVLDDSFCRV